MFLCLLAVEEGSGWCILNDCRQVAVWLEVICVQVQEQGYCRRRHCGYVGLLLRSETLKTEKRLFHPFLSPFYGFFLMLFQLNLLRFSVMCGFLFFSIVITVWLFRPRPVRLSLYCVSSGLRIHGIPVLNNVPGKREATIASVTTSLLGSEMPPQEATTPRQPEPDAQPTSQVCL